MTQELKEVEGLLLKTGDYGNISEIHRQAVRKMWEALPTEKRVLVAVSHYRESKCTITKAAVLAGVPYFEMKKILQDEGALRLGFEDINLSKAQAKKFSASAKPVARARP